MKKFFTSSWMKCGYAAIIGGIAALFFKESHQSNFASVETNETIVTSSKKLSTDAVFTALADTDTQVIPPEIKRMANDWKSKKELYEKLKKEIPPSGAPAAEVGKLLNDFAALGENDQNKKNQIMAKLAVFFNQWLEKNPQEAFQWSLDQVKNPACEIAGIAFYDYAKTQTIQDLVTLYQTSNKAIPDSHLNLLVDIIANLGSAKDYTLMRKNLEVYFKELGNDPCYNFLGNLWNLNKKDELLKLSEDTNFPQYFKQLTERLNKDEQAKWLTNFFANPSISEDAKRKIVTQNLRDTANDVFMPIEQRIELLKKYGGLKANVAHQYAEQAVISSTEKAMDSEKDYAFQFRHGVISAQEILQDVKNDMADMTGREKEFSAAMYHILAQENAAKAESLITGGDEDLNWARINAARLAFRGCDPRLMNALTENEKTDTGNTYGKNLGLKWSWEQKTEHYLDRFGENYVTWVKSLPNGRNKTLALQAVYDRTKDSQPKIAEDVKANMEGYLR